MDEPSLVETVPGYLDLTPIGQGGFSVVYRARQEAFDRPVALKVLTAAFDEESRQRFLHEVRTAGRLSGHPHVVSVFDVGTTDSGKPYLAMDLCAHGSVKDRQHAIGALPAREVAEVGAKIADALAAAHESGVLHCDVKPGNILLTRFGEPALADFGLASLRDSAASPTMPRVFTPQHVAPEVAAGNAPSEAADIYGLGSTLYHLLTARAPFDDAELARLLWRVVHEEPAALTCPDLPALAPVVRRAMAKRPEDRYPTARALATALREVAERVDPEATNQLRAHTLPQPEQDQKSASRKGKSAAITVTAVVLAVAGIAAGVTWWQLGAPSRAANTAAPPPPPATSPAGPVTTTPTVTPSSPATAPPAPAPTVTVSTSTVVTAPPSEIPGDEPPPSTVGFVRGSDTSVNGCKAWLNYFPSGSGGYTQALLQSWGNDCVMRYSRGPSSKKDKFDDVRQQKGAGTLHTNWYWTGPGYYTTVCVWKSGSSEQNCGGRFYVQDGNYRPA